MENATPNRSKPRRTKVQHKEPFILRTYRVPPDVDAALGDMAATYGMAINHLAVFLLRAGLQNPAIAAYLERQMAPLAVEELAGMTRQTPLPFKAAKRSK